MFQIDAIILAGSSEKGIKEFGVNKSQLKLNDKRLVEIALDALAGSGCIERIFVIGNITELEDLAGEKVVIIQGGNDVIGNIARCIDAYGIIGRFLVSASDLPFITAQTVRDFISGCTTLDAQLFYPIVPKEVFCHQYPEYPKTFFRLSDGIFTSGSVFIADAGSAGKISGFVQTYFNNRKHPLKLAGMIGFIHLLKFLFGRLSVLEVTEAARKLLGAEVAVVISRQPQLALDLDRHNQLELVRRCLADQTDSCLISG